MISDKGFTSVSVNDDAGAVGRTEGQAQAVISLPAGTKAAAGTARELVLPPGSSFEVVSVRKAGGTTHVEMRLVPARKGRTVSLSAETPGLSVTPHPFGSPAGPGLFRIKGLQLDPYIQNVAHALLRTGRAKDESQAIQMAIGVIQRWARGGGKVHPEVRAAAAKALAAWEAARAAAHAHANGDGVNTVELGWDAAAHPRVAAGSTTGGQFAAKSGGQQGQPSKKQQGKSRSRAAARQHAADAVRGHMAGQGHKETPAERTRRQQRNALWHKADTYRAKAHQLSLRIHALESQIKAQHAKTAAAKPPAAPKKAANAAKSAAAKKAAQTRAHAGKTAKTAAKKAASKTASAAKSGAKVTVPQMRAKVTALREQVRSLYKQAAAADRAARAIK